MNLITQNTQRLAKRQLTWFRRDTEIEWFDPEEGFDRPSTWLRSKL
jgi:tRNA dimethylallyltransferase